MPSSETPLDDKENDHPFPRYSLSKMDMLSQIDQPAVAMEVWQLVLGIVFSFSFYQNWGLMLFDTDGLLIDTNSTNADDRYVFTKVGLFRSHHGNIM